MKIIDLSLPIFDDMPVYPGDPKVEIKRFLTLAENSWNMNTISLPAHIATHVNVPIHGVEAGKTLDDYSLDSFFGKATVFKDLGSVSEGVGLIFESASIGDEVVQKIIATKPKFIAIQGYFESDKDLETEKLLLEKGIISFEGLANVDKLPKDKEFMFYGFPLKIKEGDGSPVRAVAILE